MLNPSQLRAFRIPRIVLSLALTLVAVVGLSLVVTGPPSGPVAAATDASCTDGNFPTPIEADVTFSGDLFVTGSVVVRNGATLTLTAGSHVTVCGPYDLNFANGALHAAGTSEDPITIAGETPETRWGRLFFNGNGDPLLPSVLRHVILDGGGGSDPTAAQGTVHIYDAHLTDGAGPVVEDVTVRNSGAYGIYVRVRSEDTTPPLLSGLTVTNSARAPVLIWASAVGGLGEGNTFTGNAEEAIEVRAGTVLGGDIRFSQTWLRQPIPYRMVNEGGLGVNGATTPTLALMPGTTFRMDPDFTITIAKAHLVVEGTLAEPITFEPTFPGQSWRGIVFQGSATVVPKARSDTS